MQKYKELELGVGTYLLEVFWGLTSLLFSVRVDARKQLVPSQNSRGITTN